MSIPNLRAPACFIQKTSMKQVSKTYHVKLLSLPIHDFLGVRAFNLVNSNDQQINELCKISALQK
jgi:hypothetical protein